MWQPVAGVGVASTVDSMHHPPQPLVFVFGGIFFCPALYSCLHPSKLVIIYFMCSIRILGFFFQTWSRCTATSVRLPQMILTTAPTHLTPPCWPITSLSVRDTASSGSDSLVLVSGFGQTFSSITITCTAWSDFYKQRNLCICLHGLTVALNYNDYVHNFERFEFVSGSNLNIYNKQQC